MANTKELRHRIKSVKTTQQMTKAMKMVAAAKLRRAQDNITNLRPYAVKLNEIMGNLTANVGGEIDSPYASEQSPDKVLLVVITSNRGLCGAFNTNVNKEAVKVIKENYATQEAAGNLEILAVGKKAFDYFSKREYKVIENKNFDVFANLSFDTVDEVASMVMEGYTAGRWNRVDIVFNEFVNVMSQERKSERFLPIAATPVAEGESTATSDYIFEPSMAEILEDLIPKSLRTQFYKSVLESNAGEHGARMVAMDNATTNAEDLLKELKLAYNQARQAAITTEILEIVAGAEALASAS